MICPHCEKSLLRKERPGNVCGGCRRRYALDPKTSPLELSDLRVRRVLAKLTEEGRLPCTPGHLWYALSRRSLRSARGDGGCVAASLLFGGVLTASAMVGGPAFLVVVGVLLLLLGVVLLVSKALGVGRGRPRLPRERFHSDVLGPWARVYGGLPPGVVDDRKYPRPGPEPAGGYHATLLCPDLSVAAFLAAEGLPARFGLLLAREVSGVLAHGPVLVLHDAGARGLLLPGQVRAALPGRRVVGAGPPLRVVRALPNAVPYRERRPGKDVLVALTATGDHTEDELAWLRRGWSFPLVAIPPVRLLAVVGRDAERMTRGVDPEWRRAAGVGFLTWPSGEAR
ncbi:hypothetical protein [Streptomyces sp. NPDC057702]|uniref:hypothetical protein n=1 Tax=unclassified Streptomyces TaxID=2593676 RepID=UPI0036D0D18D